MPVYAEDEDLVFVFGVLVCVNLILEHFMTGLGFVEFAAVVLVVLLAVKAQQAGIRRQHDRVFLGVCSGIAWHFGWPVAAVRILTALLVFTTLVGGLAYVVLGLVLKED